MHWRKLVILHTQFCLLFEADASSWSVNFHYCSTTSIEIMTGNFADFIPLGNTWGNAVMCACSPYVPISVSLQWQERVKEVLEELGLPAGVGQTAVVLALSTKPLTVPERPDPADFKSHFSYLGFISDEKCEELADEAYRWLLRKDMQSILVCFPIFVQPEYVPHVLSLKNSHGYFPSKGMVAAIDQ